MRYVVGIDLSTKRIDMAAIPLLEEPRLGRSIHLTYCDVGGTPKDEADRIIRAGQAARTCIGVLHARGLDISCVAVERPSGERRNVAEALLPIYGGLCVALDDYPVAGWRPREWRAEIGTVQVNRKEGGHWRVLDICAPAFADPLTFDEHQLDAIGVALAHRAFLLREEAA